MAVFFSESDMLPLLELTHSLVTAQSAEDFRGCLRSAQGILFFDHAIVGLAQIDGKGKIEKRNPLNLNYPQSFVEEYFSQGYEEGNPILREVMSGSQPQFWTETATKTPSANRFWGFLRDFGFQNGCSHGLFNPRGGTGSYLSFQAGWLRAPDQRFASILSYLTPFLHQGLCRVHRLDELSRPDLSPREVETLRCVRSGKNTWEASQAMGVSQNTVKFHLKNAMTKLGASNRSHALALALQHNLLGE